MDEVAVTVSKGCCCVWQLRSGSILQNFKNNVSSRLSISPMGFVLSPQENKAYMHAYKWNKESVVWKSALPEKLISVCCSSDGRYSCGGGGSGVAYLWDMFTGELLTQWQAHFNEILGASFLGSNNEMIITSGKDSMIHCWLLSDVLQSNESTPFRSWSGHALPVTSLQCTNSRVLSSSLDHTCKIWSVTSDEPISSIIFPSAITCTVINQDESMIYAGSNDGKIYAVNFLLSESHPTEQIFEGHTKPITSLSVSLDGTRLLSSSLDGTAKVWDTKSFQLIRNFSQHGDPVTYCEIALIPRCLFEDSIAEVFNLPFTMFKKYSPIEKQSQNFAAISSSLPIDIDTSSAMDDFVPVSYSTDAQEELQSLQVKVIALENQLERWSSVGKQLFKMKVNDVEL